MSTAPALPVATASPGAPAIGIGGGEPAETDAAGGYRIVIDVSAAGDLSVGLESDASDAVVDPGTDTPDAMAAGSMKPCADIKAALTEALRIYKANGADMAAERDFESGFAGVTG